MGALGQKGKIMSGTTQALKDPVKQAMSANAVTLDFAGVFEEGSFAGTAFSGRFHYDSDTVPSDRHISFSMYEHWQSPVATVAIGGHILTADGAAVYNSIFDGSGSHYDFLTMYGSGPFDANGQTAFCEFYFADDDAMTLDGTDMPSADQLANFPVKQLSFGTNEPGNVMSVGSIKVSRSQ